MFQVFKPLCEAAGVRAVLLAAQCSQALETIALLGNQAASSSSESFPLPGSASLSNVAWPLGPEDLPGGLQQQRHDLPSIVVATPGRLVAHLQSTPGFNVQGLRFLVCPLGFVSQPVPCVCGSEVDELSDIQLRLNIQMAQSH